MGLNLHPTQQSMPQMVPPAAQQSVHGGTPIAPASPDEKGSAWEQDHVSEVNATPSASNGQASRASRKRAQQNRHVPRGADMSHQHIEAFNERFSDLRVKEVMEATAEHQFVYTEPTEEDIDRALRESIKKLEEDEMAKFTKERDQIRATVAENVRQGGGSRRGAGGANPQAKQSSPASCASSRNTPVSSDPPGAPRAVTTPQKDIRARVASAGGMSDEDVGGVMVEEQPAAPEVDLDRSKSPMRSPPRSRRHVRRDDAAQRAGSPLHRSNARRWRGIGAEMYYASGRYESGPDGAKFRSKHRGAWSWSNGGWMERCDWEGHFV
jgi:hypothetical protein